MATTEEIAAVREMIGEPDDTNGWTDEKIGDFIDAAKSTRLAAADIWSSKASKYSTMVDISESGSSRKMSGLLDNALKLAKAFREGETAEDTDVDPLANRPRTRAIVRP
jgi:hypothetical protein